MVPHVGLTALLERLSSNSDLEESLATAALAISFILASLFDLSFRIVSTTILVLTVPSTRLIVSHIVFAVHHLLLSLRSLVLDFHLAVSSSSLSQAVTRHLVNAIPILLLIILIILTIWSTLSGFYPCDVADSTTPSTPRGPQERSPMSFRRARGIPVLKLPPDQTPTPWRERERRYLEIIEARDARISRRAKRIEKLTLRLDQAREAVAARDATIAGREQTISDNVAALAERDRTIVEGTRAVAAKDAIIARLTKDSYGEHLRSDNADVLSMLTEKAAHISDLYHRLDTASEAEERREAAVKALHSKVAVFEADLSAARAEAVTLRLASSEKTIVPQEDVTSSGEASAVVQTDELISLLQAEVLKLQRELDSLHCRIVEKEALLAIQATTIDDLRYERDADIRSAETQIVEHLTSMGVTYGQEAANPSLAEHHLPPVGSDGLEMCTVTTDIDVYSLTEQLDAARQEALDAQRLQKAYEEVADAGAVRVIELVQQLEEQKELSEVDRELFLVRIRKLTALLDKARTGIPVPDKAFAQLRLPANTRSVCTGDVFTAVTPRLPASTEFPSPSPSLNVLPNERKLRRRSAIENLRQPLTDLMTCATANPAPLGGQLAPRSRLPRPSSLPNPGIVTRSPPALKTSTPAS